MEIKTFPSLLSFKTLPPKITLSGEALGRGGHQQEQGQHSGLPPSLAAIPSSQGAGKRVQSTAGCSGSTLLFYGGHPHLIMPLFLPAPA